MNANQWNRWSISMNMNCPDCGEAVSYIYNPNYETVGTCMKAKCGKKWAWRIWEVTDELKGEAAQRVLFDDLGTNKSPEFRCLICRTVIDYWGYCSFACQSAKQVEKNEPPVKEAHNESCMCFLCVDLNDYTQP